MHRCRHGCMHRFGVRIYLSAPTKAQQPPACLELSPALCTADRIGRCCVSRPTGTFAMMRRTSVAATLSVGLMLSACGSSRSGSDAPPPVKTTTTSGTTTSAAHPVSHADRRSALLLRDVLGSSVQACARKGAIVDDVAGATGAIVGEDTGVTGAGVFCYEWGATILTGLDVASAVAQRDPNQPTGWCVTPTLTPAGSARLRAYMATHPGVLIPLVSHGKVLLGGIAMDSSVSSGACWITSDGMSESSARSIARALS